MARDVVLPQSEEKSVRLVSVSPPQSSPREQSAQGTPGAPSGKSLRVLAGQWRSAWRRYAAAWRGLCSTTIEQRLWRVHMQRSAALKRLLRVLGAVSSFAGVGWWWSQQGVWVPQWVPFGLALALGLWWARWATGAVMEAFSRQTIRRPVQFADRRRWYVIAPDRQSAPSRYLYDLMDGWLALSAVHALQWIGILADARSGGRVAAWTTAATHALVACWVLGAYRGWWTVHLPAWRWPGRSDLSLWTLQRDGFPADALNETGVDVEPGTAVGKHLVNDELRNSVLVRDGALTVHLSPPARAGDIQVAFGRLEREAAADADSQTGAVRVYYDESLVLAKTISASIPGWNDHAQLTAPADPSGETLIDTVRCESDGADWIAWAVPRVARRTVEPRLILVIVLDGVRQDLVGLYSGRTGQTPFIDRFFADGARYTQAFSQGEWTKSAFASMATGRYPSHHRVTDRWFDGARLPSDITLLSEELQRQGYFTCGVVSHFLASQHFGHARGYDQFVCWDGQQWSGHTHRQVTERALQALEQHREEPVFLFLHYFDVHFPFHFDTPYVLPGTAFLRTLHRDIWNYIDRDAGDQAQYFQTIYENKLREVDLGLSGLFGYLEQSGRADQAAVVLTADTGINLPMEPGMTRARKKNISISSQHVPFLVRCPWRSEVSRQTVEGFVEASIDLYPTVLDLAGRAAQLPPFARSVLPDQQGRWPGKACSVAESIFGGMHQILIVDREAQYLRRSRWQRQEVSEEVRNRPAGGVCDLESPRYQAQLARYRQIAFDRGLVQWERAHAD